MSKLALISCIVVIFATHFFYYPKWQKSRTEATISWDVSGYYLYLPAAFIYKDLKHCAFYPEILEKYAPTPDFQQAFLHPPSGNYVMKYAVGQAIVYAPFFAVAHFWALNDSRFLADGYSFPYQFMISMSSLFLALFGLIFLRKILVEYFEDRVVAVGLVAIVLGTNYLNYSAIDGAMTHNSLFSIYTFLIYLTILFYKKPSYILSIGIGSCVGLAALIRPTEIISAIIPILWGVNLLKTDQISTRFSFFIKNKKYIILAVIISILIGFIQLAYWKFVSGQWVVYSYEDQGFSWLSPHLNKGMFGYRSGWLVYTPMMIFALIGFVPLFRMNKKLFFPALIFFLIFIYITFAWDEWWYGGSLGQRAMIQAYPILAFPMCALIQRVMDGKLFWKWVTSVFAVVFIYANLWFTHNVHLGGMIVVGQMNKAYFWKTLFKQDKDPEYLKLLDDVKEIYQGELINPQLIYQDTIYSITLNPDRPESVPIKIMPSDLPPNYDWIRVNAKVSIKLKEWDIWRMTYMIVEIKNGEEVVRENKIRIQRLLEYDNEQKIIYLDVRKPRNPYTSIDIMFSNRNGQKEITIEDIEVIGFIEE